MAKEEDKKKDEKEPEKKPKDEPQPAVPGQEDEMRDAENSVADELAETVARIADSEDRGKRYTDRECGKNRDFIRRLQASHLVFSKPVAYIAVIAAVAGFLATWFWTFQQNEAAFWIGVVITIVLGAYLVALVVGVLTIWFYGWSADAAREQKKKDLELEMELDREKEKNVLRKYGYAVPVEEPDPEDEPEPEPKPEAKKNKKAEGP